jgi:hypothetical protein
MYSWQLICMFVRCDDALQISYVSVALFTTNTFKSLRSWFRASSMIIVNKNQPDAH